MTTHIKAYQKVGYSLCAYELVKMKNNRSSWNKSCAKIIESKINTDIRARQNYIHKTIYKVTATVYLGKTKFPKDTYVKTLHWRLRDWLPTYHCQYCHCIWGISVNSEIISASARSNVHVHGSSQGTLHPFFACTLKVAPPFFAYYGDKSHVVIVEWIQQPSQWVIPEHEWSKYTTRLEQGMHLACTVSRFSQYLGVGRLRGGSLKHNQRQHGATVTCSTGVRCSWEHMYAGARARDDPFFTPGYR